MLFRSARKALDADWSKLQNEMKAWDLNSVCERADVIARCKKEKKSCHFGTLMTLCHEKHSELQRPEEKKEYKGRVVLRGDQIRDETGYFAVFSEQGTSASHLAAAKFLDAIARFPGNSGSDSDAIGAYTQVPLQTLEDVQNKIGRAHV